MAPPVRRVMIWGIYRSLSSALSRAFVQRTDTHVVFEPFCGSYYLSEERVSDRYAHVEPDPKRNYNEAWKRLLAVPPSEEQTLVVGKDFPNCVPEEHWDNAPLSSFMHIFLIRHPEASLASMVRMESAGGDADWTGFDDSESGFTQLDAFYDHICEQQGHSPMVIDSDELGANPEEGLRLLCESIGIEFEGCMLRWNAEKKLSIEYEGWADWFARVQAADGFEAKVSYPESSATELPKEVQTAITRALPSYEKLASRRTVIMPILNVN